MKERDQEAYPAADDESFLSRWSMRKQAAREQQQLELESVQPAPDAVEQEPPELTDEDMPPLESLNENSDYRGFLSPKVSDELRRLALRKLFHAADFNYCDGLDDYAEDFTSFEKLGDIITSDMRFQMEREARKLAERQRLEEAAEEAGESPGEASDSSGEAELQTQDAQASANTDEPTNPDLESDKDGTESGV